MDGESKIVQVAGRGIPVRGDNIDTDRIIPARYLRAVTFEGLGEHVFEDERKAARGHPFDDPRYRGASILVVNRNFGSGSSREHAPQALMRWGIKAIVGVSFAEIFFGNCRTLGIPCAAAAPEWVEALQSAVERDPALEISLDLEAGKLRAGHLESDIEMDVSSRESFVSGNWDALAELLGGEEDVKAVAARLPYVTGFEGR